MTLPSPPPHLGLLRDEPMARHTYLRLGGPAAYFGVPADLAEFDRMIEWARSVHLPVRIAGGGSNVLVSDVGVRALVVSLRRACGEITFDEGRVEAGAGVMLPSLARQAAERSLGGLEFAIGIPGSVGGALQTNAGISDGRSVASIVRRVDVIREGTRVSLERDEIWFDYRNSSLREAGDIVLGASFGLTARPREQVEAEMRRLLEARQASQPTSEPNAGSVFRNPAGDYSGRLIEAAGCKGLRIGGAQVSTLHANFIVQDGAATAGDVVELMTVVQERVRTTSGISLVPEIEWWGYETSDARPAPWQVEG